MSFISSSGHSGPAPGGLRLEQTYARLPPILFQRVLPTPVRAPRLVWFNHALAADMGLDGDFLSRPESAGFFTGNALPPGADPIAQAYAGHQYGHFTRLGDGRAILLGEHRRPDGARVDVQLKGGGPTAYSRRGDGRAALGPMLREVLVGEAMHALGIPTTRSLAVAATGEEVFRDTARPGAVLTRIASSHIRVGTFEYAAALHDPFLLRALADYTLRRHYPDCADSPNPTAALLRAVVERQAALTARWMLVGFVHGVMNTDNMAVSGETIDYGPCAFMEACDPDTVFSSIDRHGRYAYGRQPSIAQWNLARFAECLLPLLSDDPSTALDLARGAIASFPGRYQAFWMDGMAGKLGLPALEPGDEARILRFVELLEEERCDYTGSFLALGRGMPPGDSEKWADWFGGWSGRIRRSEGGVEAALRLMRSRNPAVIPRNHKVEEALVRAEQDHDLSAFNRLRELLMDPFNHERQIPEYQSPMPSEAGPYRTFCGT